MAAAAPADLARQLEVQSLLVRPAAPNRRTGSGLLRAGNNGADAARIAVSCMFATIDLVMQSPLQRLYKTKFVLVALVATVVGTVLLFVAGWPSWQTVASLVG